jgi:hypothetical protein
LITRFAAALGDRIPTEDEDINKGLTLYIEDNMPIENMRKANCEFCEKTMTNSKLCNAAVNKKSGNILAQA